MHGALESGAHVERDLTKCFYQPGPYQTASVGQMFLNFAYTIVQFVQILRKNAHQDAYATILVGDLALKDGHALGVLRQILLEFRDPPIPSFQFQREHT